MSETPIQGSLSNLVNKLPLTYHSGLIDEYLALFSVGGERSAKDCVAFTAAALYNAQTLIHSPLQRVPYMHPKLDL
jgi:hypothetical protein